MHLSADAFALLRTAMRARPTTLDELTALSEHEAEQTVAIVGELRTFGCLLADDAGALTYPPPEVAVGAQLVAHLQEQRDRVESELATSIAFVTALQTLTRDFEVGAGTGSPSGLAVELIHGPMAPRDASFRLQTRRGPVPTCAVLPDPTHLEGPDTDQLEPFLAMMRSKSTPDRVLVGPHDGADEQVRRRLELFSSAGALFRTREHLPGWFAVDGDDTVVLPCDWGVVWPTSVMLVTDRSLAALAQQLFDLLWVGAQPVFDHDPSWRPLVRLMASGMTTEAAARSPGISSRTARRRLEAAMRHHGARTTFELGVAVGRADG